MGVQSEPRLWIEKLILYKSINPVEEIRMVKFKQGVNIVWGQEEGSQADETDGTLSGHSVGKTSLCRLIRYCLGENSYGKRLFCKLVSDNFETGYVGMQLRLEGNTWAILRPFNLDKESKADKETLNQEFLNRNAADIPYQRFVNALADSFIETLKIKRSPGADKEFEWHQFLAWLTRDQETRFQKFNQWRASRSEAQSLRFSNSDRDATFLVRSILELVDKNEIQLLNKLELIKSQISENLAYRKRIRGEVEWQYEYCLRQLKFIFNKNKISTESKDSNDLLDGILAQIIACEKMFDDKLKEIREKLNLSEKRIEAFNFWIQTWNEKVESGYEISNFLSQDIMNFEKNDEDIQDLKSYFEKHCTFGDIDFRDCEYYLQAVETQQSTIPWDHSTEDNEYKNRSSLLKQQYQETINKAHQNVLNLLGKRDSESHLMTRFKGMLTGYKTRKSELLKWSKKYKDSLSVSQGGQGDEEKKIDYKLSVKREELRNEEAHLKSIYLGYGKRLQELMNQYRFIVKRILSDEYNGIIMEFPEKLTFSVGSEIAGMNGEAVESLSLIIADIACMNYGLQLNTHPGFLLHDSPREADLSRHVYRRYLQGIVNIGKESIISQKPFQYIITTTSEPPSSIDENIRLKLAASAPDCLLFKKHIYPVEPIFAGKEES